MNTENTQPGPDSELPSVLRELDRDSAAVDHVALRRIRDAARRELKAAGQQPVRYESRQSSSLSSRAFATLAASAAVLLIALTVPKGQADERPSLGELLAEFDASEQTVMDVEKDGEATTIQFQRPGTVTWKDGDNNYRIADGNQLWRVTSMPDADPRIDVQPSPLPTEGLTALGLLQLGDLDLSTLNRVSVSGSKRWRSVPCSVYEADIRFDGQAARLQAYAGREDEQLKGLRVVDRLAPQKVLAEINVRNDAEGALRGAEMLRTSLRDDGRIGQLSEVHGLVFLRSFPGHRWTPVSPSTPLYVGDQIRCETIGAHAAVVRLNNGCQVTAGPGTQLGFTPDRKLLLQNGDVRVTPLINGTEDDQKASEAWRTVKAPNGKETAVGDTVLLRIDNSGAAIPLELIPSWLITLDANQTTESLGSLVAQVDGRDVSLTMGFHHVTVDVRNQIARTVIEESFVNNTDQRLEGVFHFPLPHDASISGFGMWIGDQLVEADVVEKQRARQIYETILREKRDPGLLEWEGGNIFKARVFPIEPHREKKIRIVYTQTLPLRNGTFHYSYALRSDLLQKTPLRDLTIDVLLHSEVGVGHVDSPSHPTAELQATDHSASLHYSARDITPRRDFEFSCRLASDQPQVVAIPHVRGDDGYFMLQLSPPAVGEGNWSRTLVRDGSPLDVIILCDTSLSMDPVARGQQSELLKAILGSLSESDRVRVACTDAEVHWVVADGLPVDQKLRDTVVDAVRRRRSLGWSNLKPAFEQSVALAKRNTQIIYIGDGTPVAESASISNEFTSLLSQLGAAEEIVRPRRRGLKRSAVPAVHGIAVGNAFDMNVIRAMGRIGGGTSRAVTGTEAPVDVARQLLFEITRPGLKNLKVEFRNVDVAAVYPTQLPNLADGMQHIITGRFRPGVRDADAEVVVTGHRGDERVTYAARMPLNVTTDETRRDTVAADRTDQNSFIPRLWAKAHLDQLLLETESAELRSRIVRLSQTYHLMTPFTSLLVLESDADRERFGVQKSTQMRDGEEFFAAGREEAEYGLRQKQLAVAKAYRQRLNEQFNQQISRLTMLPMVPLPRQPVLSKAVSDVRLGALWDRNEALGESTATWRNALPRDGYSQHWGFNAINGTVDGELMFGDHVQYFDSYGRNEEFSFYMPITRGGGERTNGRLMLGVEMQQGLSRAKRKSLGIPQESYGLGLDGIFLDFGKEPGPTWAGGTVIASFADDLTPRFSVTEGFAAPESAGFEGMKWESLGRRRLSDSGVRRDFGEKSINRGFYYTPAMNTESLSVGGRSLSRGQQSHVALPQVEPQTFDVENVLPVSVNDLDSVSWPGNLRELFPDVVHARPFDSPDESERHRRPPLSDWPEDVVSALKLLDRSLQSSVPSIQVRQQEMRWHTGSGERLSSKTRTLDWAENSGWLIRNSDHRGPVWQWSIAEDCGSWLPAFGTGRRIPHKAPPEKTICPISIPGAQLAFLEWTSFKDWSAKVLSSSETTVVIELTSRLENWQTKQITLHRKHRCVLSYEERMDGQPVSRTEYSNHVRIGDVWLPERMSSYVHDPLANRLMLKSSVNSTWTTDSIEKFNERIASILPADVGLFLNGVMPRPSAARSAIADGTAAFEHQLVRVFELIQQEQWNETITLLDKAIADRGPSPANQWLRWEILRLSDRLTVLSQELPVASEQALDRLPGWVNAAERLEHRIAILRRLNGYWERCHSNSDYQPFLVAVCQWLRDLNAPADLQIEFVKKRIAALEAEQLFAEADELRKKLIGQWPYRYSLVESLAASIAGHGTDKQADRAYRDLIADRHPWNANERDAAFKKYLGWLRTVGEFESGLKIAERWAENCSHSSEAWGHVLRSYVEVNDPVRVRLLRDRWIGLWTGQLLPPDQHGRFRAAFEFGLGRLAGLSLAGPQREIRSEMLKIATKAAHQNRHLHLAKQVFGNNVFIREPDGQLAFKRVLSDLRTEISKLDETAAMLPFAHRLTTAFDWLQRSRVSGCDEHNALLDGMRLLLDRAADKIATEHLDVILLKWGTAFDEHTPLDRSEGWRLTLQKKWQRLDVQSQRDQLADLLRRYESATFDSDHQLAWHRFYLEHCRPERRRTASRLLFDHLLTMSWTNDREQETWSLIDAIAVEPETETPDAKVEESAADAQRRAIEQRLAGLRTLATRTGLVQRWSSASIRNRIVHQQSDDEGWDDRNNHQKTVLNKQFQVNALRAVLAFLTERKTEVASTESNVAEAQRLVLYSSQLRLHALSLVKQLRAADVTSGVNDAEKKTMRADLCQEIRSLLGTTPALTPDPNRRELPADERAAETISLVSRHWLFANWLSLAFEQDADNDDEVTLILDYVRSGQKVDTVAPRAWRAAEYGILVAADRPTELESLLRNWMAEDKPDAPWRRHLGHLLAELDRVEEAVALYEAASASDLLSAGDWRQLSVWQHALDRRADKEASEWESWRRTSYDNRLNQLRSELNRWKQNTATRTPTAPTDVIKRLRKMSESTASSSNTIHLLMEWYVATHDPRVLKGVAQPLIGRTESNLFGMLSHTQGTLRNVDQEAGLDSLYESIRQTRSKISADATRSADQKRIDLLGLDLLKLQVAACGSQQNDQPGAHAELANQILKELSQRKWTLDTAPWLAQCLANLGATNDRSLREGRIAFLTDLLDLAQHGSIVRLKIAASLADALRHDRNVPERLRVLESSVRQHLSNSDSWPSQAKANLSALTNLLKQERRYLQADSVLRECQQQLPNVSLEGQIWSLRISALQHGGTTLVGQGTELYEILRDSVTENVYRPKRYRSFDSAWSRLQQVFNAAHDGGVANVHVDVVKVRDFAPTLLRRHSHKHQELINAIFGQLSRNAGRRPAIQFLIQQLDAAPVALQWTQPRSVWQASGEQLFRTAYNYQEGSRTYDLRATLAPIRAELEDALFQGFAGSLESRDSHHRALFGSDRISAYRNGRNRIVAALLDSARRHADSEPHLKFLLEFHRREWRSHPLVAIQILETAMDNSSLSVNLRVRHIDLLMSSGQHQRALTLLDALLEAAPLRLDLRQRMMKCCYNTGRRDRLRTEYEFVLAKILDVPNASWNQLSSFASQCRFVELWAEAAGLYKKAIDRHGTPTGANQQFSSLQRQLAECLCQSGETNAALDAVSVAWVFAGQNPSRRQEVRQALDLVLKAATDLKAAAEHISTVAEKSGEESSLLRRALGKAFVDSGRGAAAIEHLKLAIELRAADEEARRWLVMAYDQTGESDLAVVSLLDILEQSSRSMSTCKDLANRYAASGDIANAERARTSIVESAPLEAEHHIQLASVREQNENWDSAIAHWKRAVSLRSEDPAPLIRLATAELQHGDKNKAWMHLKTLDSTDWDERFEDVMKQIRELRRQIPSRRR